MVERTGSSITESSCRDWEQDRAQSQQGRTSTKYEHTAVQLGQASDPPFTETEAPGLKLGNAYREACIVWPVTLPCCRYSPSAGTGCVKWEADSTTWTRDSHRCYLRAEEQTSEIAEMKPQPLITAHTGSDVSDLHRKICLLRLMSL